MNRKNLQEISRIRTRESRILLDAGYYNGAYYVVGYSVECALKACVAKQVKRYDFPDKKFVDKVFTHDLEKLMELAGLMPEFQKDIKAKPTLRLNWTIVKDWSEEVRYKIGYTEPQARDLYFACTGRNGILPWIRKRW